MFTNNVYTPCEYYPVYTTPHVFAPRFLYAVAPNTFLMKK